MGKTSSIAVIHLVRAGNGLEPFDQFLASYARYSAGEKHDLVIVFKGFAGKDAERAAHLERMGKIPMRPIDVDDRGYDLHAYSQAARLLSADHLCFLNSYSELLEDGWLAKMQSCLCRPNIGLVGATGSFESRYSNVVRNEYRWRPKGRHRIFRRFFNAFEILRRRRHYDPFPNPHIRTNAFMLRADLMRQVWPEKLLCKESSFRFESGRAGLTASLQKLRLESLVVGRDGVGYPVADWPSTSTFRQGDQHNLLIADNQTRLFAGLNEKSRGHLALAAWENPAYASQSFSLQSVPA